MKNFNTENSVKDSSASSIKIFENADFGRIRVAGTSDEPLFCLSDICKVLELTNPSSVKSRLDPEDVQLIDLHALNSTEGGGNMKTNFVTESGFYDVILQSSSPRVRPFRKWVTSEVLPAIRKTGTYSIQKREPVTFTDDERMMWKTRYMEEKRKTAELLLSIKERTSIPEVAAIADAYATNILVDKEVVALPEAKEKTYSATEIGRMLGVSANRVGKLSKAHNLKTEEYGKWFYDKSRHSNKEVESFRYYEKAIGVFRKLLS